MRWNISNILYSNPAEGAYRCITSKGSFSSFHGPLLSATPPACILLWVTTFISRRRKKVICKIFRQTFCGWRLLEGVWELRLRVEQERDWQTEIEERREDSQLECRRTWPAQPHLYLTLLSSDVSKYFYQTFYVLSAFGISNISLQREYFFPEVPYFKGNKKELSRCTYCYIN